MKLALASLLFVLTTGCVVRGQAGFNNGYNAGYYQPDLVTISPGVQVVYDYDEPIFYSDQFYWRYYGNTWYRSSQWNNGWVAYNDVPWSIRTNVRNPNAYVRYRPANFQPRYNNRAQGRQPVRQQPGPVVRDHRQPQPIQGRGQPQPIYNNGRGQPQPRPQPVGPTVRDHRSAPPPPPPNQGGPTVRDHRR